MSAKPIRAAIKAVRLAAAGKYVSRAEIAADYDRISTGYDEHFSRHAAAHSDELVAGIKGLPHDARILDLACGTGAVVAAWRRNYPDARLTGVDGSAGMLAVARRRCPDAEFVQGDMEEALGNFLDESLDAVSCAWAIGYAEPLRLARTVWRKLKPGGVFAVVENRRDTWPQVRKAAFGVAMEMPESLVRLMDLHLRLPKSAGALKRLLGRAGFARVACGEGAQAFTFASGEEVLAWSLKTGVSAGFDRAMDPARRAACDAAFIRRIEQFRNNGILAIEHRYVWAKGVRA